ncbi:stp2p [Saccharomyces arboricola H-6]|uniref:Transcription factor STP1 n=1 Tax=Saccharomyces arboricola (strain H-6 / AS 2.3317 / CBS 10644) TaxID=1160507 RepID=J8Q4D3_SACAR|nr:stp2p [Saccharomyces arboricola H-6]
MPILSLSSTRDSVFTRIYDYLKSLVQQVIVPHFEDNKSPKRTPSNKLKATIEDHTPEDCSAIKENDPVDISQLFPDQNNRQLGLLSKSSVVPCALNLGSLQTPFSIDVDKNGIVNTRLNLDFSHGPTNDESATLQNELSSSPLLDGSYINNEQYKALFPSNFIPITPISSVITPASKKSVEESPLSDDIQGTTDESSDTLRYVCHYCDARFRIRGYLTRHIKKHAIRKAYHCPFFDKSLSPELRCHTSGGFSRRDTYKTHLKSRHFNYPDGVKPQDRGKSSGACAQCGEYFNTSESWVENHIEAGSCKGLPEGYSERIREKKKTSKMKMIKTSDGQTRFISSEESVLEPRGLLNGNNVGAAVIHAKEPHGVNNLPTETKRNEMGMDVKWFEHKHISESLHMVPTYTQNSKETPIISPPILSPQNASPIAQEYQSSRYTLHMASPALSSASSALSPLSGDPIATTEMNSSYPLDLEQSLLDTNRMEEDSNNHLKKNNMISINEMLQKQMDFELLGENHLKETQDYLALYKKTNGIEF